MDKSDASSPLFYCMSCGVKLRAKPWQTGRQLPCPRCGTILAVPPSGRDEAETRIASDADIFDIRRQEDDLRNGIAEHDREEDRRGEEKDDAEIAISSRPKPPPWPLLQGVFAFLLTPGAVVCWLLNCFLGGLILALLVASFALIQIPTLASWAYGMIFLAVSFVLGLIFMIVNGLYSLTILQESAAGNRIIEEWPGTEIFNLLGNSLFFFNSIFVTLVANWAITYPLSGHPLAKAVCWIACTVVVFPVVLLSMLETDSFLLPLSSALWQSLFRSWRSWLVFYAESFLLAFFTIVLLMLLAFTVGVRAAAMDLQQAFLIAIIGVSPVVLVEMVYFRLMGRLAWVCGEDARRRLAEQADAEQREVGDEEQP